MDSFGDFEDSEIEHHLSLYTALNNRISSVTEIARNWTELYLKDKYKALADLIQLFENASAFNGVQVTPEMVKTLEHYALTNIIEGNFVEKDEEFITLITKNKKHRFKIDFCLFLIKMIQLGEEKMIYDGFLIKNLTSILKHLSRLSQKHLRYTATLADFLIKMIQLGEEKMIYDGFLIKNLTSILKHLSRLSQKHLRYTATLAGLTITTALADIVETMNLEINRLSRRIENLSRRNQSHLESLHEKNTELIDKQAELEMMRLRTTDTQYLCIRIGPLDGNTSKAIFK
ncbi:cohesin subunit SA-2-like [Ctenocephalides felis]|uniref:cohesin subunit SA-2-like n=1 Tax=Ctenocephalides felis TaxID=7515 RepID=UPI000E6E212C|nr:cohesin subunit SA-2-like [Ctenocephalides felis]